MSSMCRSCRQSYSKYLRRAFSDSSASRAAGRGGMTLGSRLGMDEPSDRATYNYMDEYKKKLGDADGSMNQSPSARNILKEDLARIPSTEAPSLPSKQSAYADEPYHLNVYAHKHNTHITFTEPSRNTILSFSCGNIGLRNAQKASYDASFQLCAYTFRKMAEKQWKLGGSKTNSNPAKFLTLKDIVSPKHSGGAGKGIEIILRGYGPGREAFQKALLGTEGRMIKPLISKITDGTRLKFGGTRSPQVRRLG